jgi:hypothetical protein
MSKTDCFNESYEDFTKRNNYHEHRLYLKNKYCCDANSCNNLANDYEKLTEECNEAFKRHYETDIAGKIMEPTSCSMNENTAKDLRKKAAKYGNKQNEGLMPTPLPINGPILNSITKSNPIQANNYSETGGSLKKYRKKNKNNNKSNKSNKNKSNKSNKNKSNKNKNKIRKRKVKSCKG